MIDFENSIDRNQKRKPFYGGWIVFLFPFPGTSRGGYAPENSWPVNVSSGETTFVTHVKIGDRVVVSAADSRKKRREETTRKWFNPWEAWVQSWIIIAGNIILIVILKVFPFCNSKLKLVGVYSVVSLAKESEAKNERSIEVRREHSISVSLRSSA